MIRVYRYGLLRPTENGDIVRNQMLLAHRYYNTLTEIERGRRTAIRSIQSSVGDMPALEAKVAAVETELESALEVHAKERARTRKRSETPEMKSAIKQSREKVAVARAELKEYRSKIKKDPAIIIRMDDVAEKAKELQKSARAYSGLARMGPHFGAWGTYLLAEASAEQSRKTTPFYDDPQFRRWTGEGRVGAYTQGGLPVEKIFGTDSWSMRVDPVDEKAWYSEIRGERRKHSRTTLRLRMGSDNDGNHIWAAWPMVMHRPIPEGALIKNSVVTMRKIGPREEWVLLVTADLSNCKQVETCGKGRVAVNFGWRVTGDKRVRVATFVDDEGGSGEIELVERFFSGMEKAESLRSIRDRSLEELKPKLADVWGKLTTTPKWFQDASKFYTQWRSHERFHKLVYRWKENRFAGDDDAFAVIEAWRYNDHHLWQWETSQREKSLRSRKDHYRCVAKTLTTKYGEIVIPVFDKREVAKSPKPEEAHENETSRLNRQRVAISELEMQIKNSASASGCKITSPDGSKITHICAECAERDGKEVYQEFDAAASIKHACEFCGEVWDQDENACRNLLRRASEKGSGAKITGGARNAKNDNESAAPEKKWARAARLRAEKMVEKEDRSQIEL